MPQAKPRPEPDPPVAAGHWPVLKVSVPPTWKVWLEDAAVARGLSVAALVRQCIRALMISRHENGGPS